MATQASKMNASRPSFASIVAMAHSNTNGRAQNVRHDDENKAGHPSSTPATKPGVVRSSSVSHLHDEVHSSIARLSVRESPSNSHAATDQENCTPSRAGLRFDDNQTQISSSSTKPASLDGKSATSGTTFALDEKESLRPDDSASVKAADEEDLYSGPASGAPSSRVGSEAESRAFRDQFHEINERMGPGPHRSYVFNQRGITGIEEEAPQLAVAPLTAKLPTPITLQRPETIPVDVSPFGVGYHEPDEKLFEALDSPKDRMFLLRLEQDVIAFVKDSKEPMIDLPPCNSFCRLLAHKLADYYALTHFVDNAVSSVRLFRTPYCRLPTPLSAIPRIPALADAAPFQPAVKIMRRAGVGKDPSNNESGADTTESSINPSKAGSEAGEDSQRGTGFVSPSNSATAKDKATMTREEREAKYKETRERIFKGFEDTDNVDGSGANEATNQVSRASSVNEKKKTKKRNNDDGFEARSKFNAYYPTVQYTGTTYDQSANSATYFNPYSPQPNMPIGQPGALGVTMQPLPYQPGYPTMAHSSTFPTAIPQMPMMNDTFYNGLTHNPPTYPMYNQPTPAQYYQPVPPPMAMGQQSPALSSPALSHNGQPSRPQSQMSDQQWQQNSYPYPYQRPRDQQQYYPPPIPDPPSAANIHPIPYQYGQLPYQTTMQGGRTQHPLPGSYTRQTFNPQTRSFVPNAGVPPPGPSFGGRGYDSITRGPGVPLVNGKEMAPYVQHPSPYSQLPSASIPGTFNQSMDSKGYGFRKGSSAQANGAQSPVLNSISKYGAPAHLPPKPPPPETPSLPDAQHALPSSVHAAVNMQLLSNGQSMPSFQNGVYSMPSVGDQ